MTGRTGATFRLSELGEPMRRREWGSAGAGPGPAGAGPPRPGALERRRPPLSVHIGSFGAFPVVFRHFLRRERLTAPKAGTGRRSQPARTAGRKRHSGRILPAIFTPNAPRPPQRPK